MNKRTAEKTTMIRKVGITDPNTGIVGVAEIGVEYLQGNKESYFTFTAWFEDRDKNGYRSEYGGACTDIIGEALPQFKKYLPLHGAGYPSGAPMHAVDNALYWVAGCFTGGLGEKYHGGGSPDKLDGKSPEECKRIFMEHLRITEQEYNEIFDLLAKSYMAHQSPKETLERWINANLANKWRKEAAEAEEFIRNLPGDCPEPETEEEKILKEKKITCKIESTDINKNCPDWNDAHHYRAIFRRGSKSMTVYYSQGFGITEEPKPKDILKSILQDMETINGSPSFAEWCRDLGYEEDSRKAERTYRLIHEQKAKYNNLIA